MTRNIWGVRIPKVLELKFVFFINQFPFQFSRMNFCNTLSNTYPNNTRKPGDRQCHARAILTDDQAREIFKCKPASNSNGRYKAALLARSYGVSAKTVRDIWVGRTWYWATFSLETTKPILLEKLQKKLGRPKGSRDTRPRNRKQFLDDLDKEMILDVRCDSKINQSIFSTSTNVCTKPAKLSISSTELTPNGGRKDFSWHELLIDTLPSEGFEDPFHDDWAFWPDDSDPSKANPVVNRF